LFENDHVARQDLIPEIVGRGLGRAGTIKKLKKKLNQPDRVGDCMKISGKESALTSTLQGRIDTLQPILA